MKISCLMPTFNRVNINPELVNEAVNSFLIQTYNNKELIICNDAPGQTIQFNHPQVKVINAPQRFETLSHKIRFMIGHADGDAFCRWDDDDISLPWRLQMSVHNLGDKDEWRCERHFYSEKNVIKKITLYPGNSHNMSIWTRTVLNKFGNGYPMHLNVMGSEDQAFNQALVRMGYPLNGTTLEDVRMIFYIYRWGVTQHHLSGHPNNWTRIASEPIPNGTFKITPSWRINYVKQVSDFLTAVGYRLNEPD